MQLFINTFLETITISKYFSNIFTSGDKKVFSEEPKGKLMCVPMNYFAIVYKLFNNLPLQEEDYHFDYEGLDSKYCENFRLITDFDM